MKPNNEPLKVTASIVPGNIDINFVNFTLRDCFALVTITGILSQNTTTAHNSMKEAEEYNKKWPYLVSKQAYRLADAMLEERNKQP